jgi:hypothetical protein
MPPLRTMCVKSVNTLNNVILFLKIDKESKRHGGELVAAVLKVRSFLFFTLTIFDNLFFASFGPMMCVKCSPYVEAIFHQFWSAPSSWESRLTFIKLKLICVEENFFEKRENHENQYFYNFVYPPDLRHQT